MVYNKWGKPTLKHAPYFNWSHSAGYVVFVWSHVVDVGVDVEKKNTIEWNEFGTTFNKDQWVAITTSKAPNDKFYYYWVINEAIIKAMGMGLSFDVKEIGLIHENCIAVNNEKFRLKEINVHPEYLCYLAFRGDQIDFNFEFQVSFGLKY